MLVATRTFVDETDGQLIEAGKTYVAPSADVARSHPECFKPAPAGLGSGWITRVSGIPTAVVDRPKRRPALTKSRDVEHYGLGPEHVEIRTSRSEPQFTIRLGSSARQAIEDEISFARSKLGPDYECGGWLYGPERPRSFWDSLTVAVATHAGNSEHGRSSITFGETATELMLRSFPPELGHMKPVGDWHSHPSRGSTIPSDGDARGWARSLDEYGFNRYTAIIVSPSEGMGWMHPVYTGWTVRREGNPSRPVVEPALVEKR